MSGLLTGIDFGLLDGFLNLPLDPVDLPRLNPPIFIENFPPRPFARPFFPAIAR
jgi:hypothetical protein